jgi:16S rRNA pseudouridine516 synthase
MQLRDVLFSQGFGTRRHCEALIRTGQVSIAGRRCLDPQEPVATDGLVFCVEGQEWPFHAHALLMLHKPAGYECSQKPSAWPSVMTLLPGPLRNRGVQPVGRLDQDTTGLLLLTDDGALIHRLTSPKHHVPKIYEVVTDEPVTPEQLNRLRSGVVLRNDPRPVRATACESTGTCSLRLTLTQGKYHQVKRMMAAVGHRLQRLHRSGFGALRLPDDLPEGQWRWLDSPADIFGSAVG